MGVQTSIPIGNGSHRGGLDIKFDFVHQLIRRFSLHDILAVGQRSNPISGLVGSLRYTHENLFGGSDKLKILLEKGVIGSNYLASLKRTSLYGPISFTIQNSLTPEISIHGIHTSSPGAFPDSLDGGVRMHRLTAKIDQKWDVNPNWSKTFSIMLEKTGPIGDDGHPVFSDQYGCPITFSGNSHDKMLVAKLETEYSDSDDWNYLRYNIQMEQGLPVLPGWLFFYRLKAHVKHGVRLGPVFCFSRLSGGTVVGNLAPHDSFPIGGFNSVRGYGEGALGSGRSCLVGSNELRFPLNGRLQGAIFADFGSDIGSGRSVYGNPAGVRGKRGTGFGRGFGIRFASSIGSLRIDFAMNDKNEECVHFGFGYGA